MVTHTHYNTYTATQTTCKKLVHILTLFVIFRVQYDEFRHLLYTKAYTTCITHVDYLQYNTITYDTNNTNAYTITRVAYNG